MLSAVHCGADKIIQTRIYNNKCLQAMTVSEDVILSKNWDILTTPNINYEPHPMYGMKMNFYRPIEARIGIKFMF